ncbi:membrane-associated, eicosanoid/glutathione metabolism protein [Colletotrichum cereale]|nr:membrane-associated, eicosanoid/glutathione metabolism protein [Colletotrichum cereale]
MSAQPIGLTTFPRLLPVTGTFALPFTLYYAFLSLRVVGERLKDKHYLGENSSKPGADTQTHDANKLYLASRSHVNFAENVPLAFVLATLIELNGGNRKTLGWLLGSFLALRVFHAELGIMRPQGMGSGRPVGYFGSIGVLGTLAAYGAYLTKGYWGY